MAESRFRNHVLNPCPTCGKQFDVLGCMTYVDEFLEKLHGGKCPGCGTPVVIRVSDPFQPEVWERAKTQAEIRAVAIEDLELSVRTRRSLEKRDIVTVGDLLDSTESQIRKGLAAADPVIAEVRELLASKGLSIADS